MATIGAQLTATGVQVPDYADILQELKVQFWQIYGSDVDLDNDSMDGQWIAVLAQIVYDSGLVAQAAYAAFSPATAQGTQLSRVVKINGIERNIPSNSQANVVLTGQADTVVNGGIIGDNVNLGTQWSVPNTVIGMGGTVTVTATCLTAGAVTAAPGTLTNILTPTRGWQSVTNPAAASPGLPVETDAQLRARQSVSTSLPAQTVLDSIYGSIATINGVARLAAYENDTDIADSNGLPPHSISFVVDGGDANAIANAIALKKTPGTRSYGTTQIIVVDPAGVPNNIGFFTLQKIELIFEVDIHALSGFVSTTEAVIQQAVADFTNALAIGETSYTARLYTPANQGGVGLGATYVVTAIKQAIKGNPLGTADIPITFIQAAVTVVADVTITLV